jgi:hypothetical protein
MEVVREATIESFNQFVIKQKALPGEASVYFVQFNVGCQVLFDKSIAEAPTLSYLTYQPNGGTALYDAMGYTIDSIGQRLNATPEYLRPNKVVFVVLTDGEENSSRRYSQMMIADRIEHQRNRYAWEFVFLGANQDAILTARGLNIPQRAAMSFAAAPRQVGATVDALSNFMGSARAGRRAAFLDSERDAAMGLGENEAPAEEGEADRKGGRLFSWLRRADKSSDETAPEKTN